MPRDEVERMEKHVLEYMEGAVTSSVDGIVKMLESQGLLPPKTMRLFSPIDHVKAVLRDMATRQKRLSILGDNETYSLPLEKCKKDLEEIEKELPNYLLEVLRLSDSSGQIVKSNFFEQVKYKYGNKLTKNPYIPVGDWGKWLEDSVIEPMVNENTVWIETGEHGEKWILLLEKYKKDLEEVEKELPNYLLEVLRLSSSGQIVKSSFFEQVEYKYGNKLTKNPCIPASSWGKWLEDSVIAPMVNENTVWMEADEHGEKWILLEPKNLPGPEKRIEVEEDKDNGKPPPPRPRSRFIYALWIIGIVLGIFASIVGILAGLDQFGVINAGCLPILRGFTDCTGGF